MANSIEINNGSQSVVSSTITDKLPPNAPLDMWSLTTLFSNMTPVATPPSPATEDDIYLDDGTNTASETEGFRRYTGSVWVDVGVQTLGDTVSLNDLNDVTITDPADESRLVYDSDTSEWIDSSDIDGGSY